MTTAILAEVGGRVEPFDPWVTFLYFAILVLGVYAASGKNKP